MEQRTKIYQHPDLFHCKETQTLHQSTYQLWQFNVTESEATTIQPSTPPFSPDPLPCNGVTSRSLHCRSWWVGSTGQFHWLPVFSFTPGSTAVSALCGELAGHTVCTSVALSYRLSCSQPRQRSGCPVWCARFLTSSWYFDPISTFRMTSCVCSLCSWHYDDWVDPTCHAEEGNVPIAEGVTVRMLLLLGQSGCNQASTVCC